MRRLWPGRFPDVYSSFTIKNLEEKAVECQVGFLCVSFRVLKLQFQACFFHQSKKEETQLLSNIPIIDPRTCGISPLAYIGRPLANLFTHLKMECARSQPARLTTGGKTLLKQGNEVAKKQNGRNGRRVGGPRKFMVFHEFVRGTDWIYLGMTVLGNL